MSMVHVISLVTGEYSDTCTTVVGAYLDYSKASERKLELEDILELCALDPESTRTRIANGGDYVVDGMEESAAMLAGLDSIYVSYNGVRVYLNSYPLLG